MNTPGALLDALPGHPFEHHGEHVARRHDQFEHRLYVALTDKGTEVLADLTEQEAQAFCEFAMSLPFPDGYEALQDVLKAALSCHCEGRSCDAECDWVSVRIEATKGLLRGFIGRPPGWSTADEKRAKRSKASKRGDSLRLKALAVADMFDDPSGPNYKPHYTTADIATELGVTRQALEGRQRDGSWRHPELMVRIRDRQMRKLEQQERRRPTRNTKHGGSATGE